MQTLDHPTVPSASLEPASISLEQRIQDAIAEAHLISQQYGADSQQSIALWDIVEELQAEAGHQRDAHVGHTSLTDYCDDNPDAPEARVYDV